MTKEDNIRLIDYFHAAIAPTRNEERVDAKKLNETSVLMGYAIDKSCCSKAVEEWLATLVVNYNATFYKEWSDIVSKDRFELFVDQILHYASTYGTDYAIDGNGYVPNDGPDTPNLKELKIVKCVSAKEMFDKCYGILKSGIALNLETMKAVSNFVLENKDGNDFDVNEIKNLEAQAYISLMTGTYPKGEFAVLRCLVYNYTGSALLIKDKKTISNIKSRAKDFDNLGKSKNPILSLSEGQIVGLSHIFNRYKPIILAMKTDKTASVVNRISKLSKRNHTPLKIGFWETAICPVGYEAKNVGKYVKYAKEHIDEINNFRKVRLLQSINIALDSDENSKIYTIRNGKSFVRKDYHPSYDNRYLERLRRVVDESLVKSLSRKACRVKFSKDVDLVLPSSEKSYIGNYPIGTSVDIGKNGVVGIYWRNEWDTHDFDIHFIDFMGNQVGWNTDYTRAVSVGDPVIYSGDMTNADPEAVECMYIPGDCPDAMVNVNQYNGFEKSRFRFFVGTEIPNYKDIKNHMIDPNNIRFDNMIDVNDERQKTVGIIHDGRFYVSNVTTGKRVVSFSNKYTTEYINTICSRTSCYVQAKDILLRAGFVEDDRDPELDLSKDLTKDVLIDLMSVEQ